MINAPIRCYCVLLDLFWMLVILPELQIEIITGMSKDLKEMHGFDLI